MKKSVAKNIKRLIGIAAKEKGVEPTKGMYRGVKKFYTDLSSGEVRAEMRK